MGSLLSVNKIDFKDMKIAINKNYIIINTLHANNQSCLIENTLNINDEISTINKNLKNKYIYIIIYGENSNDNNVIKKYTQLKNLGFKNLYVYTGGLFEWLLLQDIYGFDEFPTTSKIIDILKYSKNNSNF